MYSTFVLDNYFLPVHNNVVFVILCVHVLIATVCLRHISHLNVAMQLFIPLRKICMFYKQYVLFLLEY